MGVDTDTSKSAPMCAYINFYLVNFMDINVNTPERVLKYVQKFRRARLPAKKSMWKSWIDNQVGYEMLSTGKSAEQIRNEWGLKEGYEV